MKQQERRHHLPHPHTDLSTDKSIQLLYTAVIQFQWLDSIKLLYSCDSVILLVTKGCDSITLLVTKGCDSITLLVTKGTRTVF